MVTIDISKDKKKKKSSNTACSLSKLRMQSNTS